MTDPETRHTETMDEEAEATARSWSHETPVGDANRVAEERVGNLARAYLALLSEVATLRADIAQRRKGHDDLSEANWDCRNRLAMAEAEIERLRPYEAFVAAINAAEVLTVEPFFVWTEGPEGPTQVNVTIKRRKREGEVGSEESTAPDALRAWAKARGTDV